MDIIEGKADVDREQLPPISALDQNYRRGWRVRFQFAARVRVRRNRLSACRLSRERNRT